MKQRERRSWYVLLLSTVGEHTHTHTHTHTRYLSTHTPSQEKAREMTLTRRRNRLRQEGTATPPKRPSSSQYADNELDDLIAVLKTGEFFSQRKSRSASSFGHRKLEVSRDRPTSMILDTSFAEESS